MQHKSIELRNDELCRVLKTLYYGVYEHLISQAMHELGDDRVVDDVVELINVLTGDVVNAAVLSLVDASQKLESGMQRKCRLDGNKISQRRMLRYFMEILFR